MDVQHVLCMNGGEGETSYAYNSTLQKAVISQAKPILEESIQKLCHTTFSSCLKIADLGCSSGPNTLLVVTEIIRSTHKTSRHLNSRIPGFQVFLSDLPQNDFNTIFRSLPDFYVKLKSEIGDDLESCFVTGMPGSFYSRLFPSNTLHFIHSSYSIHFLSQVPRGLESEGGSPLNKGAIYITKTSPTTVQQAYWMQFNQDFSAFLSLRSEELIPRGRMVLTFMGRISDGPLLDENCTPWTLLSSALNDMVLEGLIEESKLNSFNLPYYAPSPNEVRKLIQAEGSFSLHRMEVFEINWDGTTDKDNRDLIVDEFIRGEMVARCIRAVTEPMLVNHFGKAIMDDLFHRFMVKAVELLKEEEPKFVNLVISLAKKE